MKKPEFFFLVFDMKNMHKLKEVNTEGYEKKEKKNKGKNTKKWPKIEKPALHAVLENINNSVSIAET